MGPPCSSPMRRPPSTSGSRWVNRPMTATATTVQVVGLLMKASSTVRPFRAEQETFSLTSSAARRSTTTAVIRSPRSLCITRHSTRTVEMSSREVKPTRERTRKALNSSTHPRTWRSLARTGIWRFRRSRSLTIVRTATQWHPLSLSKKTPLPRQDQGV